MTEAELRKLYVDAGYDPEPYIKMWKNMNRCKHTYYKVDHICCPKCGSKEHSSTYVGYIMNMEHPELFKDENDVQCKCGWNGICHDLVGEKNELR